MGGSRKSDDKLEKQTLLRAFPPLLCIFRNVHSVSQGAPCCAQFHFRWSFGLKLIKGGRGTTDVGKLARMEERGREKEGEEEIVFREKLFEMTIAIFF